MGNSLSSRMKDRVELQNPKPILQVCLLLFFLSFGVRTLTWQDNRLNAWKVQTSVTNGYKVSARQLARGDIRAFLHDRDHLGHPLGYPILLAGIFRLFGESDTLLQFVQITLDSVASVVLFLLTLELLPLSVASLAGLLASISPQLAYFSVLLLPVVPAYYLIIQSALHTERRYVYVLHFFFLVLVSVALWWLVGSLIAVIQRVRRARAQS